MTTTFSNRKTIKKINLTHYNGDIGTNIIEDGMHVAKF